MYWNKPINEAQFIVKLCVDLIKKKLDKSYQLHIISYNDLPKYVKNEKVLDILYYKSTINDNTIFTRDLLRTYLIYEYGGIYLDISTLIFNDFKWVNKIYNDNTHNLILFKNIRHSTNNEYPIVENWFIAGNKSHLLLKLVIDEMIINWEYRDNLDDRLKVYKKYPEYINFVRSIKNSELICCDVCFKNLLKCPCQQQHYPIANFMLNNNKAIEKNLFS